VAFFQCCESSPFKDFTKEWGSSTSTQKKMKDSSLLQPLFNFLAFGKDFFRLPSLILDLESFV
jgi:hypothetical protein